MCALFVFACSQHGKFSSSTEGNSSSGLWKFRNEPVENNLANSGQNKTREEAERRGKKFAIATQGEGATQAAAKMIELGGNGADAATAATFAISVERPQSTGIGGGGFLLYFKKGMKAPIALDFREIAPSTAHEKMYQDEKGEIILDKSLTGAYAVAIPGLVAGILQFHRRYGKLPLTDVLAPAIHMAKNGIKIYPELAEAIVEEADRLKKFPASQSLFFHQDGTPLKVGDILKQPDLAKTLEAIQQKGVAGFYGGRVATAIVETMRKYGNKVTKADLQKYLVKERKPVAMSLQDYQVYSMAPPSSGGTHIAQILGVSQKGLRASKGPMHDQNVHLTASAMQMAFYDRARYMGDPDYVKVPVAQLIGPNYVNFLEQQFLPERARKAGEFQSWPEVEKMATKPESSETTHFSILTSDGEAVASTQTINGHFGSAITVPGTGIVLNNEMDDFAAKVGASNLFGAIGGTNNLPVAGKRPLSSMSPTLVFGKEGPIMAVGTPSGTRILTCVAQTLLNRYIYGLDLFNSLSTVRFHQQWQPDKLFVEHPGFPPETTARLQKLGYDVELKDLGCRIQAVENSDGTLIAVTDPRGEGAAFAQ